MATEKYCSIDISWPSQSPSTIDDVIIYNIETDCYDPNIVIKPNSSESKDLYLKPPEIENGETAERIPCTAIIKCNFTGQNLAIAAVDILSNARNIEVFSPTGEYIMTAEGIKLDVAGERKLYLSQHTFDEAQPMCSLKFVSLVEQNKLWLHSIHVTMGKTIYPSTFPLQMGQTIDMERVNQRLSELDGEIPDQAKGLMSTISNMQKNNAGSMGGLGSLLSGGGGPGGGSSAMPGLIGMFAQMGLMSSMSHRKPQTPPPQPPPLQIPLPKKSKKKNKKNKGQGNQGDGSQGSSNGNQNVLQNDNQENTNGQKFNQSKGKTKGKNVHGQERQIGQAQLQGSKQQGAAGKAGQNEKRQEMSNSENRLRDKTAKKTQQTNQQFGSQPTQSTSIKNKKKTNSRVKSEVNGMRGDSLCSSGDYSSASSVDLQAMEERLSVRIKASEDALRKTICRQVAASEKRVMEHMNGLMDQFTGIMLRNVQMGAFGDHGRHGYSLD